LSRQSTSCLRSRGKKDVDARDKRGHDGGAVIRSHRTAPLEPLRPQQSVGEVEQQPRGHEAGE
jgi:hypothetical protein